MGVKVSDARKDALKDFLGLFAIHFQEIWGKKP